MPIMPTISIVPTKTYPFILPWQQFFYHLLIEARFPCYQALCQNWFHLTVSYKLVVTKIFVSALDTSQSLDNKFT